MLQHRMFWMALLAIFAVVALALPALAETATSGEETTAEEEEAETAAQSFNFDDVRVNGYGTWGYGKTNENHYLQGTEAGDYSHTVLSLGVNAKPHEQLAIVLQVRFENGDEGEVVQADYAFGEWAFTDGFKMRVGQVKLPFGLYTEIFQVGTLRPFLTLPQGIYGGTGIVSEAFRGASVTGAWYGSDWGIEYDGYGGQLSLDTFDSHFGDFDAASASDEHGAAEDDAGHGDELGAAEEEGGHGDELGAAEEQAGHGEHGGEIINNLVGGRFNLVRPMSGVKLGFSVYSGTVEGVDGQHVAWAGSGEYLSGPWSIRSEYGYHQHASEIRVNSAYFEGAYKITRAVQAAFRYDWSATELPEIDTSEFPSLLKHRDLAIGLNYWFRPEFVVKFAYHIVNGNRFALPEHEEHALEEKTSLFSFGASFSF